ncbi:MAG: YjdF family protein [Eggerthellaceae bacterium]|nr:YjdF family protein [Eggerthellaceae bacterium]
MQISVSSTLTVYHDGQFWVGLVEHVEDGKMGVARIVFGAEPSDEEVLQFVARRWEKLAFFGSEEPGESKLARNPKRRQREAAKALARPAVGAKAQRALSEQREAAKQSVASERSRRRAEEAEARFAQRQEKRRQKHRGH